MGAERRFAYLVLPVSRSKRSSKSSLESVHCEFCARSPVVTLDTLPGSAAKAGLIAASGAVAAATHIPQRFPKEA